MKHIQNVTMLVIVLCGLATLAIIGSARNIRTGQTMVDIAIHGVKPVVHRR